MTDTVPQPTPAALPETGFEDSITCPVCGEIDEERADYPSFGKAYDGTTAHWHCIECGADCLVTLCVTYTFSARLLAPEVPNAER